MRPTSVDPTAVTPSPSHCPACGQPLPELRADRCPQCGHHSGAADREATDKTPYGCSAAYGAKAFRETCWWVCGASAQRLTHLALMPGSPASRRFVFWMILLLAFSAALLQLGWVGWHTVTNAPTDETSPARTPAGRGWYHLAEANPPPLYQGRAVPTDVWWNPTQAILAAVSAFVATLLAAWIILACQHAGTQRALGPRYRDRGRLDAALRYGTAWLAFLPPAAVIAACARLPDISAVAQWPIVIPPAVIYAPALVIAIISVCGYGFGLVRLAATVPVAVRTRVMVFLALWNPLIIVLGIAGTAVGWHYWVRLLVPQLDLAW